MLFHANFMSLKMIPKLFVLSALSVSTAYGQSLIFSDQMDAGTGWGYSHGDGSDVPVFGDSSDADFGFDYSAFGIPEAPNSDASDTATSGLRVAANLPGTVNDDAILVIYEDASFTGQYTVQVDLWMNWASTPDGPGEGSTEFGGLFVGSNINDAQNSNTPGLNGAGLTLNTDGDCGNCDYILNKDGVELDIFSGQYSVTDFGFNNQRGYDNTDINTNPANGELIDLQTTFPAFDIAAATNNMNASGTQPAGAAGFQWVTITAEVDTTAVGNGSNGSLGTAKFSIENAATGESVLIGTVDNSVDDDPADGIDTGELPVNMEGGLGLTWIDFFNGAAIPFEFGFGVYDNVRVFDGFLGGEDDPDLDGDGDVDGGDFLAIQRTDPSLIPAWEAAYPGTPTSVSAVPEPSSAMLLLASLAVLATRRC